MSTTLSKPKQQTKPKQQKRLRLPHTPNYITIDPPGNIVQEKIAEMGMDVAELAKRMKVPIETVELLFRADIPLTEELAKKIESITKLPAHVMMRSETRFREKLAYAMQHPEIPAYWGDTIINQPPKEHLVLRSLQEINERLYRIETQLKVKK
jgi:plasmid maintenance system antidote protein VapI